MNVRRSLVVAALLAAACLVALAAALAAAPQAAAAPAAPPQISVPPATIDYATGTVTVAVDYPAGTASVVLTAGAPAAAGQPLQTIDIADPTTAATCTSNSVALKAATTFTAQGFAAADGTGQPAWGPVSVTIAPADLRPTAPSLGLPGGSLIETRFSLAATTGRPATRYVIHAAGFGNSLLKGVCTTAAGGRVVLASLRLPYGPETVRLWLANAFGSSPASPRLTLFDLGPRSRLPKVARFVLVDKRSMSLYDIFHYRVLRHYPVAIGTPQTPTPNGLFKLGKAQPASGPWGPMRRPLYRFKGSRLWASGFFIHGTDAPWSIGTMASHGCVRMFDSDIRLVTRYVPVGVLVQIRP